jgi:hypothetical protein
VLVCHVNVPKRVSIAPCKWFMRSRGHAFSLKHASNMAYMYSGTFLSRKGKLCVLQVGIPRSLPVAEDVYVIDIATLKQEARPFIVVVSLLRGFLFSCC